MAEGQGYLANGQLVKGAGCGTREWRETFALTAADGFTPLFSVSKDGQAKFASFTTTQKNALSASAGAMVFDITLGKLCFYNGSAWETVTSA